MQIGSVVYSKTGRDQGRVYLIHSLDSTKEGYVWVVDGEIRTLAHPKHLHYKGEDLPVLAEKLTKGVQVFDSEIKSALRAYAK